MADDISSLTAQQQREIMERYQSRFGDAGDFDTWLMPGDTNLELMAEALVRGTPVTEALLHAKYREVTGEEPPEFPEDAIR